MFADANLEALVKEAADREGEVIRAEDLYGWGSLIAGNAGILSLDGVECLTNLWYLRLSYNQITDVSDLASLTSLGKLYLGENQITDVSALTSLTRLDWLGISGNQITDVSVLASLTDLKELVVYNNKLTNISGLDALTQLRLFRMDPNPTLACNDEQKLMLAIITAFESMLYSDHPCGVLPPPP